jgi:inner membrane protein
MLGISHLLISGIATSLFLETSESSVILTGAIAGLLPDIDTSMSPAGRMFPWIAGILEAKQSHRGISHSLFASAIVGCICYVGAFFEHWFLPYASAITIGFTFGWFADTFTQGGVQMFWPSQVYCICPGNRKYRLKTGSNAEYILLAMLIGIALTVFGIESKGGMFNEFNRLIAAPSGVVSLYNEQGNSHKIITIIKGTYSSDRSKVDGKFLLLRQIKDGFIVYSHGSVYKASNEPDAQIVIESITADVGELAVTTIDSLYLSDEPIGEALSKYSRPGVLVFVSGHLKSDDQLIIPHDSHELETIKASNDSYTLEFAPLEKVLNAIGEEFGAGELEIRSIISTSPKTEKSDIDI